MTRTRGLLIVIALLVGAIAYDVVKSNANETVPVASAEKLLTDQAAAWNRGDLDGFLKSYDMNDNITFFSDDRVSQGWVTVSDRYQKHYGGGKAAMGKLEFSDLRFTPLAGDAVMARGRWTTSETPNAGTGLFTLLIRKTPNGWKIVHDHTSAKPKPEK